jgi:peptidoglycan/xylan/chitin deacetylase (PgdA/CDA1 family)
MYHYVRPLSLSRYPRIKALNTAEFDEQLDYLQRDYTIISMEDLLEGASTQSLPPNSAVLTFDDGFIDHYTYVFPRLIDRNICGAFYPSAAPVTSGRLLDVHRIHFILASVKDPESVIDALRHLILDRVSHSDYLELQSRWGVADDFDTSNIVLVKRLLQVGLPRALRSDLCGQLFKTFVSVDENAFVEELYMGIHQLRLMRDFGMHMGSHTVSHEWLSGLSTSDQECEIDVSLTLLEEIGVDTRLGWTMAYPYGDHSEVTRDILRNRGCSAAFTTVSRIANVDSEDLLQLPRIDTAHVFPF